MSSNIILDARLLAAAELVRTGKIVADIGTDHALLPCFLMQREQNRIKTVIASDINENPLKSAEETIEKYSVNGIELVLSDGVKGIAYAEDIIIAGMGGETILEIITGLLEKDYLNHDLRLILQPMTRHSVLRRGMCRLGFEILCEKPAYVKNKAYTVIHAAYTGKCTEISGLYAHIGKQKDIGYIKAELAKIKKRAYADSEYKFLAEEVEKIIYEAEKNI